MTARRYEPILKIASGGTAAVYVGSAVGALGFRQLVAIKRPHAHLADDPAFCAALVEEAKIASRLHHANVVDVRDVEVDESGIQLVMDYVEGASLSELIRSWAKDPPPRPEAASLRIILDACEGLRALHELAGDDGAALGLVHRDVSPANVLVGVDGVARIADFGLAKPLLSVERTTSEGALRGKLGYMAPEYIRGKAIDRRVDVWAMGVVLWEVLAKKRLFRGENDADTLDRVQQMPLPSLAETAPHIGKAASDLDAVIVRALARDPEQRLATIDALSSELEKVVRAHDLAATHGDVRDAFGPTLRAELDDRRRRIQSSASQPPSAPTPAAVVAPAAVVVPAAVVAPSAAAVDRPAAANTVAAADALAPATASTPAPAARVTRRSRALLAAGAAAVAVPVVVFAVLAMRTNETAAANASVPRTVASDHASRSGEPRARAESSTASAAEDPSSAAPSSHASASRAGVRHPVRPISDEPGKKAPRPNPYASSSR